MKKQEIYVPIANKKESKRAKAVLEAMGEKCGNNFIKTEYRSTGGLYFNIDHKQWAVAVEFGCSKSGIGNHRTKITLKQLIEMLVSEQKEPEKIAVRVDNEKELNALMKYYDSLGWKSIAQCKPLETGYVINCWSFQDGFAHGAQEYMSETYKIIPFSEFAKEHGIRVPRTTTFDGVDVFDGDTIAAVNLKDYNKGNRSFLINERDTFDDWVGITHNIFSTPQAALDWIEAQKPKEVEYKVPGSDYKISITKYEVSGFQKLSYLDFNDIKAIHKAMEELNS